jgi:hypothetical protein
VSDVARRRLRKSRRPPGRDMEATAFARILSDLIGRLPGAYACALVDLGGETVDYAGVATPFDVKVAAAHLRIIVNDLEEYAVLGRPRWVVLRAQKRSFIARSLPEGYGLIVLLRRRAGFTASARAFAACERELSAEAGWGPVEHTAPWFPVEVEVDRRGRPVHVGSPAVRVEVFGSVMGLSRGESGFRVRTSEGTELTVVREPGNSWYSDEDLLALRKDAEAESAKRRQERQDGGAA